LLIAHSAAADWSNSAPQITNLKILALLERILLGEILGALCAFAVNGVTHFHRQGAKDAKKTPRRVVWLRLRRPRLIREIRGKFLEEHHRIASDSCLGLGRTG